MQSQAGTFMPVYGYDGDGNPGGCPEPPKRKRFGERLKFLPIAYVSFTIMCLYIIYVFFHCLPLLQLSQRSTPVDEARRLRGIIETVVFHFFTLLLLINYVLSILVHPGEIPDNDPQWDYVQVNNALPMPVVPLTLQETKKSGDRRHCKWCGKYKPDRCHHCRVCKTCILKMDHHCPWIYNCVGAANYKYFFSLLLYSVLDCHFIFWTMLRTVKEVIETEPSFVTMFLVFFGEIMALFFGILLTMFLIFHIWLMLMAMTTIEFCEKSMPKKEGESKLWDPSLYDLGVIGNVQVVLGDNPLCWFLPITRPSGDGLHFVLNQSRLSTDIESSKGVRRKTHQRTQRMPPRYTARSGSFYGDGNYGRYSG